MATSWRVRVRVPGRRARSAVIVQSARVAEIAAGADVDAEIEAWIGQIGKSAGGSAAECRGSGG